MLLEFYIKKEYLFNTVQVDILVCIARLNCHRRLWHQPLQVVINIANRVPLRVDLLIGSSVNTWLGKRGRGHIDGIRVGSRISERVIRIINPLECIRLELNRCSVLHR